MTIKFSLPNKIVIRGNTQLDNPVFFNLFKRFTFETCEIEFHKVDTMTLVIGDIEAPTLADGCEYSLIVNDNGVAIIGQDFASLMHGYFSMLMKIERKMGSRELFIAAVCENKAYKVNLTDSLIEKFETRFSKNNIVIK